jgi:hypothetical protein
MQLRRKGTHPGLPICSWGFSCGYIRSEWCAEIRVASVTTFPRRSATRSTKEDIHYGHHHPRTWGEFIGGIAVVVSLIYLAGQVRQNSRQQRASTTAATAQMQFSQISLVVQAPDMARIWWEGLEDFDSPSELDRRRLTPYMTMQFMEQLHRREFGQDGVVSREMRENADIGMRWFVENRGSRQWWHEWGRVFPPDFRDYVDGLIREGEAAG